MVIRQMEERPELANRVFLEIGSKELRFIVNFGFWFGLLLGIPTAIFTESSSTSGGCCRSSAWSSATSTNLLAILMIFEPIEERRSDPFKFQGLFLRRQRRSRGSTRR